MVPKNDTNQNEWFSVIQTSACDSAVVLPWYLRHWRHSLAG